MSYFCVCLRCKIVNFVVFFLQKEERIWAIKLCFQEIIFDVYTPNRLLYGRVGQLFCVIGDEILFFLLFWGEICSCVCENDIQLDSNCNKVEES